MIAGIFALLLTLVIILFRATAHVCTPSPKGRLRRSLRLSLEELEAIIAPAELTWKAPGNVGDWNNPANWSTNTIPTSRDVLTFDGTVSKAASVDDMPGLTIAGLITKNKYGNSIKNGTNQPLTIAGNVILQDATLIAQGATGSIVINKAGSELKLEGNAALTFGKFVLGAGVKTAISGDANATNFFLQAQIINSGGSTIVLESQSDLKIAQGTTLTNNGTFEIATDADIVPDGGNPKPNKIINSIGATFSKTLGVGTTMIQVPVENQGFLNLNSGTLYLSSGLQQTSSLAYTTLDGGNLTVSLSVASAGFYILGGFVEGNGLITGNIFNGDPTGTLGTGAGIIMPGLSYTAPGHLNIAGNYTETANANLQININANGNYGILNIQALGPNTGIAKLAGKLYTDRDVGYTPLRGTTLTFFTATSGQSEGEWSNWITSDSNQWTDSANQVDTFDLQQTLNRWNWSLVAVGGPAVPKVKLGSTLDPAAIGEAVVFTASVSGQAGIPTGTVTFYDGSSVLGVEALDSAGNATFTDADLTIGDHEIIAEYNGDDVYNETSSAPLFEEVDEAPVSVNSSADDTTFGQAVTFSATVWGTSSTPTGTVTFYDDTTALDTETLDSNGDASFVTSALAVGNHPITAVYSGDDTYSGSTSSIVFQEVDPLSSEISLSSSLNPATVGQSITFSATVTSDNATPAGSITFYDGATALDTETLDSNGNASFSTATLGAGEHDIVAVYDGGTSFQSSATDVSQEVDPAASVALTSSDDPVAFGDAVTFTAVASSNIGGVPGGTVTFLDDNTELGSATLDDTGTATYTTTLPTAGDHPIVALYSGDDTFPSETSYVLTQTVTPGSTASTTTLGSSENPATVGDDVVFTASISGDSGTPTGTVTLYDGGSILDTESLDDTGTATFSTTALAAGDHHLMAVYNGDGVYAASTSSCLDETVNGLASSTTVSSSENPATYGDLLVLTATVSGDAATPTGMVTFYDGTTAVATEFLDDSGTATFITPALAGGDHTITAVYNGDGLYAGSTADGLTQEVDPAPGIVNVSTSLVASTYGQAVTFTAAVSSYTGTPSGSVTFYDGSTALDTETLDGNGVASFTTTALTADAHSLTAVYSGDSNFNGITSSTLTQDVHKADCNVSIDSSSNPTTFGQTVVFTVTVTSAGGTPTGTVTFFDGDTPVDTETLDSTGSASFSTSALAVGIHPISVVYNGDHNFNPSGTLPFDQEVDLAAVNIALSSSLNPAPVGQTVTFTTTVFSTVGIPTGTVSFYDGSTLLDTETLDSSGSASFSTADLTEGTHAITVVYSGDDCFATGMSDPLYQVISS